MEIQAGTSMMLGRRRFERDVQEICRFHGVDVVVTEDRGLLRSNFTLNLRGDRAKAALDGIMAAYPPRQLGT